MIAFVNRVLLTYWAAVREEFPDLPAALLDRLRRVGEGAGVLIQYTGMQISKAGRAFKGFEVYVAGDGALAEPVQSAGSSPQAESSVSDGDPKEV